MYFPHVEGQFSSSLLQISFSKAVLRRVASTPVRCKSCNASEVPKEALTAMVAARDVKEEGVREVARGETRQHSSDGEGVPVVSAYYRPQACASSERCFAILTEANSIISHFASLVPEDFAGGVPALLERLEPLTAPVILVNVGHVAATALLRAISCPGPNFPVIHALQTGTYICHVQYAWRGASIAVPIYRSL